MNDYETHLIGILGPVLESVGFRRTDVQKTGYFENIEVTYETSREIVCLRTDRGNVEVFYGMETKSGMKLWPLEVWIEFFDATFRKNVETSFDTNCKLDSAKQCHRYKELLSEWLPQLRSFCNAKDADGSTAIVGMIDDFCNLVSARNLSYLRKQVGRGG